MWTVALTVLRKAWWIIPIAGLALWVALLRHDVSAKAATITQQVGTITQLQDSVRLQNQQIAVVKAAGEAAVKAATAQVVERVKVQKEVQTRWKTQYVSVPVPTDCPGAVAAGAVNAARIGKLWSTQ